MSYGYSVADSSGFLLEPSFGTVRIVAREFFLNTDNTTRYVPNFDSNKGYYTIKHHWTDKIRTGSTTYSYNRDFGSSLPYSSSSAYPMHKGTHGFLGSAVLSWNNTTKILTVTSGSQTINGSTDTPDSQGNYGGSDWADYEVSFWEFL